MHVVSYAKSPPKFTDFGHQTDANRPPSRPKIFSKWFPGGVGSPEAAPSAPQERQESSQEPPWSVPGVPRGAPSVPWDAQEEPQEGPKAPRDCQKALPSHSWEPRGRHGEKQPRAACVKCRSNPSASSGLVFQCMLGQHAKIDPGILSNRLSEESQEPLG